MAFLEANPELPPIDHDAAALAGPHMVWTWQQVHRDAVARCKTVRMMDEMLNFIEEQEAIVARACAETDSMWHSRYVGGLDKAILSAMDGRGSSG